MASSKKNYSADFANSPPLHQCSRSVVFLTAHDQQHSDDAISQSQDKFQEVHNINSSEQGKILKEPFWKEFLKVPSPAYKTKTQSSGKARVLTSTSFLDNLAGKEKKKREATEEKERRKKEHEEKRMLKQKIKDQQRKRKCLK